MNSFPFNIESNECVKKLLTAEPLDVVWPTPAQIQTWLTALQWAVKLRKSPPGPAVTQFHGPTNDSYS